MVYLIILGKVYEALADEIEMLYGKRKRFDDEENQEPLVSMRMYLRLDYVD